jgi:hypothetical protein
VCAYTPVVNSLFRLAAQVLRHLFLDALFQRLAAFALDQELGDGATLFLFGLVFADPTANDVGAAVYGLIAVARVSTMLATLLL